MKSREAALRAKRFDAEEKAAKVSGIERMIGEFERMAADLDRQIEAEERETGVRDPLHMSYSTFARSVGFRRDNLRTSILEFKAKLEAARREAEQALEAVAWLEAKARPSAGARLPPILAFR